MGREEWSRLDWQKEGKGRNEEESDLGDSWHEGREGAAGGRGGNPSGLEQSSSSQLVSIISLPSVSI